MSTGLTRLTLSSFSAFFTLFYMFSFFSFFLPSFPLFTTLNMFLLLHVFCFHIFHVLLVFHLRFVLELGRAHPADPLSYCMCRGRRQGTQGPRNILTPWRHVFASPQPRLSMCPIGAYMCHRGRLGWSGTSGLRQTGARAHIKGPPGP